MKIRNQLLFTHGLLVMLSLIIVLINIVTYQRMGSDATIINHSGKLRALSYNMSLITNRLNSNDPNMDLDELRETLQQRMNEFDSIILMLSEGSNHGIYHRPTNTQFELVKNEWNGNFKPLYQGILENMTDESRIEINKYVDAYVHIINNMVITYSEYSSGKVFTALFMNGLLIFVIILVTIYSFYATNKHIRKPMKNLINDLKEMSIINDEVSEKLKAMNTNEISEMSSYFNVMMFDQLTGVFNRRSGLAKLSRLIGQDNSRALTLSLCFLDINGLKEVNDQLGHKFGDELIISVVQCIKEEIREEDFVIRLGGDEFLIVINGVGAHLSEAIWDRINGCYKKTNQQENRPYIISVSHGIVEYNNSEMLDIDTLIKIADDKMYSEKKHLKEELKVKVIRDKT